MQGGLQAIVQPQGLRRRVSRAQPIECPEIFLAVHPSVSRNREGVASELINQGEHFVGPSLTELVGNEAGSPARTLRLPFYCSVS